jgi:hypothetical protein
MLDCPEAHRVLLHYIASDFQKFSANEQWSNPLLGANTYRKLIELVPAAELDMARNPPLPGKVEVYGYNQIQGTTRAAEIAAIAPPAPEPYTITSPTKTVAATIKDRLRSDSQQHRSKPDETVTAKPRVVKRSAVRLRERERALAELRNTFYDATTIDDSVLDFPHGPPREDEDRMESTEQSLPVATTTSSAVWDAPSGAYPAYFNSAVARKKASLKVEPRYNKSPPREVPEPDPVLLSPQGPLVAREKVHQLSKIAAAEVLGMKEQLCLLIESVDRRMEDVFCTADTHENDGEAVEEGMKMVEELQESLKDIPEAMLADKEAAMDNARPLADTTYPIAQKLTSGADAIRSHHNLFAQFEFKCLNVKDVLDKIYLRAENVAGADLLDQYRKDAEMTGFEKSKAITKPRVMGKNGKTRRLGSTIRSQFAHS